MLKIIKSVIDLDLFIINNKNSYEITSIFEFNKTIKQFLSLLNLIKCNKKSNLVLIIENYNMYKYIKYFFESRDELLICSIIIIPKSSLKFSTSINKQSMIVLIGHYTEKEFSLILNKFSYYNIFLLCRIGNFTRSYVYQYSINFDDIKKILFILLLINKNLKINK
jgi:hypothetical protein